MWSPQLSSDFNPIPPLVLRPSSGHYMRYTRLCSCINLSAGQTVRGGGSIEDVGRVPTVLEVPTTFTPSSLSLTSRSRFADCIRWSFHLRRLYQTCLARCSRLSSCSFGHQGYGYKPACTSMPLR